MLTKKLQKQIDAAAKALVTWREVRSVIYDTRADEVYYSTDNFYDYPPESRTSPVRLMIEPGNYRGAEDFFTNLHIWYFAEQIKLYQQGYNEIEVMERVFTSDYPPIREMLREAGL